MFGKHNGFGVKSFRVQKKPKGFGHMGFSIAVGLTIASGSK
jgi:hypothetical protein